MNPRKIILGVVLFSLLALTLPGLLHAQDSDSEQQKLDEEFNRVFSQYRLIQEEYNRLHEEYIFRRSQYLKYGTLQSEQEAYTATLAMLSARDDVVIAYLTALKAKLKATMAISDIRREGLNTRIDTEVGWFTDHKTTLASAGNLKDLVDDSDLASKEFAASNGLFYETLSVIAFGRETEFSARTDNIYTRLRSKVEEIRADTREGYSFSAEKFAVLDRWLFDTEGKILRSKEKLLDADAAILGFAKKMATYGGLYNNTLGILSDAQLFLKEGNSFMKEVIRSVKTAED